jgi:16S rRNA (uracil1498-N3)-methyltransferase
VQLSASQAHHLADVLRLNKGQKVDLFDGKGSLAVAEVINAAHRKVALKILELRTIQKPIQPQIIIAPSIAKGERFDWLITKCTELGVDRICPVLFERTVKQPKNPKIVQRWQNIVIAASQQCRRPFLPQIDAPVPLPDVIKILKNDYPNSRFLFGSLSENAPALFGQPFGQKDVVAFVGPEGGLTLQEENLLLSGGALSVRLTDTVLRIETAALAFTAILSAHRAFTARPNLPRV